MQVTARMTLLVVVTALCLVVFSEYARTKSAPSVDGGVISASGGGRGTGGVRHRSTLAATKTDGPGKVGTEQRSVRDATNNYLRGREARQQDRRNKRYERPPAADPKETTENAAVAVAIPPEKKRERPTGFGTSSGRMNGFDKEAGEVGREDNYNRMAVAAAEAAAAAAVAMMQKEGKPSDDSYVRYVEMME